MFNWKTGITAFFTAVLFTLFIAIISSCNGKKNDVTYTIAFSQCTGSDMWRRTMLEDMKTELSLHPEINFIYRDADGNSEKQITQVSQLLHQKIDLLIISPNEAKPLTDVVKKAYDSGVPVIVIDRKTLSPSYNAYVGADNYQLGLMAGNYVGLTSEGQTKVLEVTGLSGSSPAMERERGFNDGIKKFSSISIKYKVGGDWLKATAKFRTEQLGKYLSDVNAVFAHNDVMADGVKEVLQRLLLSKKIKVIGVDALAGNGGGLDMVYNRTIDASLLYPTGGREAIITAFKILNKEPYRRENVLQSLVIDSTNVQLMKMQVSKINSQQNDILRQRTLLAEQATIYKSQQTVLNVLVVSLVLAIVFGGLAFYSLMDNRKINKSLGAKNEEILLQKNQLIEMSAKAESATEARFNFFTNVSHEFRTPLTLMLSPLQDLMESDKLPHYVTENIKLIHKSTYRLLKLVNQLIDFRKIEIDKQKLQAGENDIVAYIKDIVESFKLYADKLGIRLTFMPEGKVPAVWFDVNWLDKVFFNLIANAIKFSSKGGNIKILLSVNQQNQVVIKIEDQGPGMTEEEQLFIFDYFYQADNAPVVGSGIGLALAKEIIELHHGKIEVSSKKWAGSIFTVTLPVGDSHLCSNEKYHEKVEWPDMHQKSVMYQTDVVSVNEDKISDGFEPPKEFTILIVEDDADLLEYLSDRLSRHFNVCTAINGNNAITETYEKVPDLIISDIVLPGLSGKEIAGKLKTDFRTSHIPIILLTAQSSIDQQIQGLNSMADMYVTKPFNFDYLLAGVNNLLKNRNLLKEHFTSDVSSPKLPHAKSLDRKFVNDFRGIVEQHLSDDAFGVEEICKTIGVSRIQLYRKVKALLGCTVNDYILGRRLQKAKFLLANEDLTIAEITYKIGFANPTYFSTVFKNRYGCTPSEFKKQSL